MHRFARIWNLMEGYRRAYGAAILALVVASVLLYLVQYLPSVALDGVLSSEPSDEPRIRAIVDLFGGRAALRESLWAFAGVMAVLAVVAGAFTYLRGRWAAYATEGIVRDLRDRLFDHLQRLPAAYHDGAETGDLVQRCTSDVETVRQFLVNQVVEIGRAV
ncbi:MAG: ABC transporter ATP-binding protein, partial [Planctomycetes bacterium]|nr:ABC transporter ATP-binding protein [Planctomycetota bacterium]